jgi:predicted phage tail protein
MITLHLHGFPATIYGDKLELSVRTVREATRLLACQNREFKNYVLKNNWVIMEGDENNMTEAELDLILKDGAIVHLYPAIEGENSRGWQIGIGVVALVVGIVLVATGIGAAVGGALIGTGLSLIVGGVMANQELENQTDNDKNNSFLFQGAHNTNKQGGPIPVGYGMCLIGSTVISVGLYADQILIPSSNVHDALLGVTP